MEIYCTLQRADYSREEVGTLLEHQALDLLRSDIWTEEVRRYRAMEEKGEDGCPPSIHLCITDGPSIAICTTQEGLWWSNYYYTVKSKKFWFFRKTRDEDHFAEERTTAEAERFVVAFFAQAHEELMSL